MDIAGCVSRRSSHLQVIALAALKNGRFGAWVSKTLISRRSITTCSAGMGFEEHSPGDKPLARRRSVQKYVANAEESLASVNIWFEVSAFGPRLSFVSRKAGGAVGAIATHTDDISGCG